MGKAAGKTGSGHSSRHHSVRAYCALGPVRCFMHMICLILTIAPVWRVTHRVGAGVQSSRAAYLKPQASREWNRGMNLGWCDVKSCAFTAEPLSLPLMTNHLQWLPGTSLTSGISQTTCHRPECVYLVLALTHPPPSSPCCLGARQADPGIAGS